MRTIATLLSLLFSCVLWNSAAVAAPAGAVRLMLIEPFSGPLASIGQSSLRNWEFAIDQTNASGGAGGRRLELLSCDNKGQPRDTAICFDRAVDAGARYVIQGLSSAAATALLQDVAKYNRRNPGKEIIYLDWAAQAESLTNELCDYWHFRFDAHNGMKIHALVRHLADQPRLRRVYILNQDYSMGHSVQSAARAAIAALPPGRMTIVGDELVPFNRVTDWAPYVAKIRSSGADVVLTGNWGPDLTRLVRTASETGLNLQWYTIFGGLEGMATTVGAAGVGRIVQVSDYHINVGDRNFEAYSAKYKKRHGFDLDTLRAERTVAMLVDAIKRAGSAEPATVAPHLANGRIRIGLTDVAMRGSDHQLQMPLIISTMSDKVRLGREGTRFGFATDRWFSAAEVERPTTCRMGEGGAAETVTAAAAPPPGGGLPDSDLLLTALLNGLAYGMLLFLLSSGFTLIFSMLGVLNFSHAAFYMLGAYCAYQVSVFAGFWAGLLIAPILVGLAGGLFERFALRRVYEYGHLAELLLTFGLALVIEEIVVLVWGPLPVGYAIPAALDFPLFTLFGAGFSAYRVFIVAVSAATLGLLYLALIRTRLGAVVRAALTHPNMVSALSYNVSRLFTWTFGIGCGLAGLAGAIAGNLLGTDPGMAFSLGTIIFVVVVIGGLGSLLGAFIASLVIGVVQSLAVTFDVSLADVALALGVGGAWLPKSPISQFAPLLPYFLMIAMLALRPRGLFGRRDL